MAAHESVTGAYPTNRVFVEQLETWGFTRLKEQGVHVVFKGPTGGRVRVVRSLVGRADADQVDKAARLAGVTTEQFWAGRDIPESGSKDAGADDGTASAMKGVRRRRASTSDRVTSLVLGVHAAVDRPLSFDQVVDLVDGRVSREQVRTASSQLCRDGDLDRVRSGVYQWSAGARSLPSAGLAPEPAAASERKPSVPAGVPAPNTTAAEVFDLLFPDGLRMTAHVLAEVEQWTALTEKLVSYAEAS